MWLYRMLLALYPASFRREYGVEMQAIFERRRRDTRAPLDLLALWMATIAETARNAASSHWDILRSDVQYSVRTLARAPAFAITAVAVLAIGIGATTAAFSVTDFVLLRPLPFPEADRLVKLWERTPGEYSRMELSPANYRDWTRASTVFESIGMSHPLAVNLTGTSEPIRVDGAAVSADLLPTLRVQPLLGRLFVARDDREGSDGTVLLSYRLWQTGFGGDPSVLGRLVRLDDEPYTVIGVMPPSFRFPTSDAQLWTTVRFTGENYVDRNDNWLQAVGRLRGGVTLEEARAQLDVIAARSRQQFPKDNANVGAALFRLRDEMSSQSQVLLLALCGAAGCVLLIACANLANLLLARALGRRRELAVRTAIGAGRDRMVRQLMTESVVLAVIGGSAGVAIALAAVPLLNRLVPATLPLEQAPTVDFRVLLFALGLTAITGVAFGLAPLLRFRDDSGLAALHDGPRTGGGRQERLRSVLVVVEVVASVVLLVAAGLLLRALWTVQARDPGFRAEGVLTVETPLPIPKYNNVSVREALYERVIEDARALPGVTHAAFVSFLPMGKMKGGIWPVSLDGRPINRAENQNAFLRYVTPGYFPTVGIPFKAGRDIRTADTADAPYVAVVSGSFIRRYWPTETPRSALGRHFNFAFNDRTVVGVVGDVRMRGLERPAEPQVYLSSRQVADGAIIGYAPRALVVRTAVPAETMAPAMRAIVHRADPALPVQDLSTLAEIVERDTASRAAQLRVVGAFAIIAFVLAGVGIHGLLTFAVAQRTQEIGVRMALGARPGDILSLIVRRAALLAGIGAVAGVALAYAAGRAMEAILAGVTPADGPTLGSALALTVLMTMAGSLVPAVRAACVDPITAIRTE